jgi:hypothetical protein
MPHMKATKMTFDQQIVALERIGRFIAPLTRWDREDIPTEVHTDIRAADHYLCHAIIALRKERWAAIQLTHLTYYPEHNSLLDPDAAKI